MLPLDGRYVDPKAGMAGDEEKSSVHPNFFKNYLIQAYT
jgi:hypothetical protein